MKIKFDKRFKRTEVIIYNNENDDDPQVLEFEGDSCVNQAFQTDGSELEGDYTHIKKDVEQDYEGKKLVIHAWCK